MTDTEKRIKIAEKCGWTLLETGNVATYKPCLWSFRGTITNDDPPDYIFDLNAMHSAWCCLSAEEHQAFRKHLQDIVLQDGHICGPCRSLSNATARQRADAFLRTIGEEL